MANPPGSEREVTAPRSGDIVTPVHNDGLANDRYQFWGPSGSSAESNAGRAPSVGQASERLQYDNPQLMTLSAADQQKISAMWAQSNGADINDAAAYRKTSLTDGGNTVGVGPFKLTAAEVMNDWANGMVNGQGLVDRAALDNYVQQGKISAQTADMCSSPEFMDFMNKLSTGQQMSPDEIQKFLPPDLQKAIAGDLVNAGAAIVGMQGGKLTSGNVLDTVRGFDAQTGQMIDFSQPDYGAGSDGIYVPKNNTSGSGTSGDGSGNYNSYGNTDGAGEQGQPESEAQQLEEYNPDPDHVADRMPEVSPLQWIQMENGEDPNLVTPTGVPDSGAAMPTGGDGQ